MRRLNTDYDYHPNGCQCHECRIIRNGGYHQNDSLKDLLIIMLLLIALVLYLGREKPKTPEQTQGTSPSTSTSNNY